jgi:hypothetical protein
MYGDECHRDIDAVGAAHLPTYMMQALIYKRSSMERDHGNLKCKCSAPTIRHRITVPNVTPWNHRGQRYALGASIPTIWIVIGENNG